MLREKELVLLENLKTDNEKKTEEIRQLRNNQLIGQAEGEDTVTITYGAFAFANILEETEIEVEGEKRKAYIVKLPQGLNKQEEQEEQGTTVEGERIIAVDGDINKEVKAIIKGNSYQETTEGINFYNIEDVPETTKNGITYSIKNGRFKANGTATDIVDIANKNNLFNLESGNYTFGAKTVSGTYSGIVGKYITKDGKNIIDGNLINLTVNKTLEENSTNLYSSIFIGKGAVLNNYEADIMLVKGTYTADTLPSFEPYTGGQASPNPNYPQDIEVVDMVNILNPANTISSSISTNTLIEKTRYRLTSTVLSNILIFNNLALKKGTYTISIQIVSGDYKGENLIIKNSKNTIISEVAIKGTTDKINLAVKDNDINSLILWQVPEGTDIVYDIQIEKGEKSSDFLPYGHIGLVQRGKNYFDKDKSTTEIGTIGISGSLDSSLTRVRIYDIQLKENFEYIVSSSNTDLQVVPFFYDSNKKFVSSNQNWKTIPYTFKMPKGTSNLRLLFKNSTDTITVNDITDLMIRPSNITDDTYEPYIEPKTIPIDLAENTLAKVGDIKDLLNIGIDGSVKIGDKVIKEYVFTGDETFMLIKNANNLIYFYNDKVITDYSKSNRECLSNYFKNIQNIWNVSEYEDLVTLANSNSTVNFMCKDIQDVTTFKAKLKELYDAGTPVKVMYATTNKQTINLPSIEPITLFKGTNVFELVANLGTTMDLIYNYVSPSPSIVKPSEIENMKAWNLFDAYIPKQNLSGVDVEFDEDTGILTLNGTCTETKQISFEASKNKIKTKANTKYTFEIFKISGKYNFGGTSEHGESSVQLWDNSSGIWKYPYQLIFNSFGSTNKISTSHTYNVDILYNQVQFKLEAGDVFNNFKIKIQFSEGDSKEYVPCETVSIKAKNKNVFDKKEFEDETKIGSFKGKWYKLKPFTEYTVSTNVSAGETNLISPVLGKPISQNAYFVVTTDKNTTNLTSKNDGIYTTTNLTRTVRTGNEGWIYIGIRYGSFSELKKLDWWLQIEEGEIASNNIVHQSQIYPLHIKDLELNGIGNIRDSFVVELDNSYSYKKVKKLYLQKKYDEYIFNGTETINFGINRKNFTKMNISFLREKICKPQENTETSVGLLLSNYFKIVTNANSQWLDDSIEDITVNVSGNITFSVSNDFAKTAEDFKAKLLEFYNNSKPLKIVYRLNKPELIDLTEDYPELVQDIENIINNMYTYEETTHIDMPIGYLELTYTKLNKLIIKNYEDRISALEKAILNVGGN